MDISTIKQKIAALEAEIVPNSVSPERVASILSDITSLVENMGYLGYEFLGVATPTASPSFDKDLTAKKYFYIAVQQGTYTNFGGLTVGANDGLTILAYNGTWTKTATGTAMKTDITSLQASVTNINTKILPLSVSFDLDKIDALTDSSGSTDIKAAFTPLSGIGVAPVAGNILRSGNVIKNSQEVTVIWSDYDSKTAYYSFSYVIDNVLKIFQTDAKTFVRVAKTIVGGDVGAEIEDLQDRVSIGKAPVWISVEADIVGDVSPYDVGTVIWRKDRNTLCEVVLNESGRKVAGADHIIEDDRIYVYGGNLCKWDGTNFIPFYQEKEEKRYLFKLDLIDSLTTATDSETAYQSFIPVGETVYKLPTTGDLLGDEENNIYADILYAHYTEAMDEGGITLSYCKDGVVKTIRITGDDYEFGTWKVAEVTTVKLEYKYNLQKIFGLSSSSGTEDIEEALTPTYAPDGNTAMRLPQSGDLLEATNGATSVVLKGSSKSFSFFYGDNRRDITLSGSAGNYKVAVVVTPLDVRVFDLDKLNALTDESSSEDIEDALVDGYTPVPGDLLQGADGYATVLCSDDNLSMRTTSFSYITGGKLRTLTVSGVQGNETIKVEEKEVGSDALRIKTSQISSILVNGGTASADLGVTFQQLQDAVANNQLIMGNINGELYAAYSSSSNVNLMSVAYLLNDWRSVLITIPKYSGTTATVTVTTKLLTKFVQIPYSFLSGEIGGTYDNVKMSDLLAANIIQTDKGIATLDTTSGYVLSLIVDGTLYVRCTIDYSDNGGLKLTARTETPIVVTQIDNDFRTTQSQVDIGISFDELKNTFFVMDKNGLLYYKIPTDHQNIIYISLYPYGESTTSFVNFGKLVIITDAGDGKINISPSEYQYKVPVLGSKDKFPAAVMPDSFIAGKGVTAIQTVTELPQSPDSGTLYLIVPSETTTSEEQL